MPTNRLTTAEAHAARQAAVITGRLEELLAITTPLLAELRQLLERVAPEPPPR